MVGDAHGRILPIRPERAGRRLRTWLAQDDEVLHRVAKRAARHELDELPAVREAITHERGWVEGRAEVRACDLCPAYDALAVCVAAALLAPQLLDVRVAADRQQQVATGTQHAADLSCSQPVTLARRAPKMPNLLSSRRTSSVGFARTHDNQRLHAGAGSGGGRSSAISRRMSPNKFLGMATSAIWNAGVINAQDGSRCRPLRLKSWRN